MAGHRREARGRKNDPEAMRRRVLDVAAELFHWRGYHQTSMQDITREARVTSGALHHHFPTKKTLGLAVIHERVARAVDETWIDPITSAPNALDGVLAVFQQVIAHLDDRREVRGCPLNNLAIELSLADADFQVAIGGVFDNWRKAIAAKLRAERKAVERPLDPEHFATFVVASYSGAMAMAKTRQSSEPLKTCARQLAALLKKARRPIARQTNPGNPR